MNRILLVRLGALGDLVHALPVAAALRRAFPQCRIDWLVDARHRELLDLVPVIDRRIAIDSAAAVSIVAGVRELRAARYEAALDVQGLLKSAVLARLSGADRVIGFPAPLLRERGARLLYTETAGAAAAHVVHKNLSILQALGVGHFAPEFPLEAAGSDLAAEARASLGLGERGPFAILNPGAAWPNKRWPPVYFAEVAIGLRARYQLRSIVTWGPRERQLAQDVVDAAQGAAAVSPQTSLGEFIGLARAAAVMVSGDTGPLHLAAAVGTPIVGLYGPTDPVRNGPWASRDVTLSAFDRCECAYQRRCRQGRWCLLDISPRQVVDAVGRRVEAGV